MPQEKDRTCGTCYACCIYLGIDELKKWPGQTCKHLDGRDPAKRCSIYPTRPAACSRYRCAWLNNFLGDDARPDESGILINIYQDESTNEKPGEKTVTIVITDPSLSGTLQLGHLNTAIAYLYDAGLHDIRVVNYQTKAIFHLLHGKLYAGKLLPTKIYEELKFEVYDPPVGTFLIETKGDTIGATKGDT